MSKCEIFGRDPKTGERVPLAKRDWVVVSSSGCPWRDSFKVEHHLRPAYAANGDYGSAGKYSVLQRCDERSGSSGVAVRRSSLHTGLIQPGDAGIVAKGMPVWGRLLGPSQLKLVSFNDDFLAKAAVESMPGGSVDLKSLFRIKDQQIVVLGSLLDTETKAGCFCSP